MSLTNTAAVQSPAMSQTVFDLLSPEEQKVVLEAQASAPLEGYQGLVVKITQNQLLGMLKDMPKGCAFMGIETATSPAKNGMRVTNNPHKGCIKISTYTVMVGANWGGVVSRVMAKAGLEGTYQPDAERANGTVRLTDKVAIKTLKDGTTHTYLDVNPLRYGSVVYTDGGKVIPAEAVEPFIPVRVSAKLGRYGLTPEKMEELGIRLPSFLSPRLENIRRLKYGGVVYEVLS